MAPRATLSYPRARRGPDVEDHFGTRVADPYRWLEDPESDETKAFVAAQNEVSESYLDTPVRKQILKALTKFQDYPKFGTPFKEGSFWYSWRNSGLQNQSLLHRHADKKGENTEVFLDPNLWTEDGTATVGSVKFTDDGSLMAYTRGDKGSDWRTIYIMDTSTGSHLGDRLQHAKFTSLQWVGNTHLLYNRYDVPEGADANGMENTQNEYQKLYCHEVGTPQAQDVLVLEFPSEPTWMASVDVTDDGKFIVAGISRSCEPTNKLWIAALPGAGSPTSAFADLQWVKVADDFEAGFEYVANDGTVFLLTTNRDAPKNKIVKMDIAKPDAPMVDVVPEAKAVLQEVLVIAQDKMVLHYNEDVKSKLYVYQLSGAFIHALELPVGSVSEMSGERKYDHFLFSITSFDTPKVIYDVDVSGGTYDVSVLRRTNIDGLPLENLEVTQEFYTSKDGTNIPMFLMRQKGVDPRPQPMLLYGYGGFNISLTPYFSLAFALSALYLGLGLAVPNIRGGGEYGIDWYKAAVKASKQVSYDDFQSAAEYLFAKGYSSPDQLAIMGGSNGGLLVGACANQRPDLFKAVVAKVGVMDLLRFNKFTIGHAWVSDYGDPDKEEDFKHIYKISPLHNINPDVVQSNVQPAVLVMTADHDDRVSPFHSLKYIAELQCAAGYSSPASTPLIAHIDTKAGHGGGKPLMKVLEEQAQTYGFIASVLGLKWSGPEVEKSD
ncbi:prolyl endopeptidase, putative [Eimeria acervulina]|uniref:Prolyl endopeptidase n=1 Tax=Eimeria acervulina TaxID=5801 RepID=U6GRN3_EIMAC|nr:prolyl endopeptidase, putative [Eimeria acervulina]CDI82911.1 prolyl endopeptidase, putative [Eimeria acervulina]